MNLKMLVRKVKNRIFHRLLGKIFFQTGKKFYDHPSLWKKSIKYLNQTLNENGWQTPFIFTEEECLEFWGSINNKSLSVGNRPEYYAQKNRQIIDLLYRFWTPEVQKDASVLELGCNCGANLFWLQQLGYQSLSGVEINPNAIEQMNISYPELVKKTKIFQRSIEDALLKMRENSVDVIFTMGVSMHIHPKNNFLFREMIRVAKKFICTIEPESANSNYVFARNYRRIFNPLGADQLKSVLIRGKVFANVDLNQGSTLRLFAVPGIKNYGSARTC